VTSESGLTAACQCRHMLPRLSQGVLLYCVNLTASVARSAGIAYRTGSVSGPDTAGLLQRCSFWTTINAAARMIYRASRHDHVSSLLKELHWLRVPEKIEFKLCALVHKCLNGNGPAYLADGLQRVTDVQSRRRLRSSSSSTLIVPATRRATLGDRAFPVVAPRAWNGLPDYVTSRQPTHHSILR